MERNAESLWSHGRIRSSETIIYIFLFQPRGSSDEFPFFFASIFCYDFSKLAHVFIMALIDENISAIVLVLFATFIGFNYGTNLSLFPSFAKGFWGMKNFGMNYGILMTAWGLGGFVFSRLSQMLYASTGGHQMSFIIAGSSLFLCLFLTLILLEIKSMN